MNATLKSCERHVKDKVFLVQFFTFQTAGRNLGCQTGAVLPVRSWGAGRAEKALPDAPSSRTAPQPSGDISEIDQRAVDTPSSNFGTEIRRIVPGGIIFPHLRVHGRHLHRRLLALRSGLRTRALVIPDSDLAARAKNVSR